MAFAARRPRLGQHFLASAAFLDRIAREVHFASRNADLVIEVGAGMGALTRRLLGSGRRVLALEIDGRLADGLRRQFGAQPDFELLEADVLETDLGGLIRERTARPAVVAGNLPFYITSPILRWVFDGGERVAAAVLLMQKEIAWRVAARPGTREFGFLSVLCQAHSRPEALFTVPPQAFRPVPRVTSTLLRFSVEPRLAACGVADRPAFLDFAQLCFRQKRKMLRNNLQQRFGAARLAGLPQARLRAEQLSVEELAALWLELSGTAAAREARSP